MACKYYCVMERGHEGVCLDSAALTLANATAERDIALARVAELETLNALLAAEKERAEHAHNVLVLDLRERLREDEIKRALEVAYDGPIHDWERLVGILRRVREARGESDGE